MILRSLYLYHFRNYEEAYIEFGPHVNLIWGRNAQGKTTLLEAIHYLIIGRSFRTHQIQELVKQQHSSFYIEGTFLKHGVEQKLRISFDGKERKILYNHTPLSTTASLLGILQGVFMTPDDIQFIKGAPALRRQFLDLQIAQMDPLYVHHLTRYHRAMQQRNQLLKTKQLTTIASWEHEMSHSAAYITLKRSQAIQEIQQACQYHYSFLTEDNESVQFRYKTNQVEETSLAERQQYQLTQLQKYRLREIALGYTTTGPHKDDLLLTIEGQEARDFASEGQQRSCITALYLAAWHRLQRLGETIPLMLIDDIGISLDPFRRQRLLKKLKELGQTFLTTTDQTLLDHWQGTKQTIYVQQGTAHVDSY
jgi:DNA replication and repair protein RecF